MLLFIFAIILVHIITSVKRLITFYFIIVILLLFSKKTDSRDDCLSRVCVVFYLLLRCSVSSRLQARARMNP